MNDQNPDPLEEEKMLFIQGRLKGIRNIEFREKMSQNPALREEVDMLFALREMERNKRSAELSKNIEEWDRDSEEDAELKIRPLYTQLWFRVAASVLLVMIIGVGVWLMKQKHSNLELVNIPVHNSKKGSFGFAPTGENDGMYVGKLIRGSSDSAEYRIQNDTLELLLPESIKIKTSPYIVNDLAQNRLILVLGDKQYFLDTEDSGKWLPLNGIN